MELVNSRLEMILREKQEIHARKTNLDQQMKELKRREVEREQALLDKQRVIEE